MPLLQDIPSIEALLRLLPQGGPPKWIVFQVMEDVQGNRPRAGEDRRMELCFMKVCLAAVLLEIAWMMFLVGKFWVEGEDWAQWGRSRPFLSIFSNMLRLCAGVRGHRSFLRAYQGHASFDGNTFAVHLWLLSSAVTFVWYCLALAWASGSWVPQTVSALTVINALLILFWVMLLYTPPSTLQEGLGALRTFRKPREAGPEASLPFGAVCVICLLELEEGQLVGQLSCGHAFHEPCISQWLAARGGCPLRCSRPLPTGTRGRGGAAAAPPAATAAAAPAGEATASAPLGADSAAPPASAGATGAVGPAGASAGAPEASGAPEPLPEALPAPGVGVLSI